MLKIKHRKESQGLHQDSSVLVLFDTSASGLFNNMKRPLLPQKENNKVNIKTNSPMRPHFPKIRKSGLLNQSNGQMRCNEIVENLLPVCERQDRNGNEVETIRITKHKNLYSTKPKLLISRGILILLLVLSSISGAWAQTTADPDHVCLYSTEDYWVNNTLGSTYTWVLSGGGTITTGQGTSTIQVNWTSVGDYILTVTETLTNTTLCIGNPVILNIIVDAVPTAAITPDPAVLCADGSLNMNGNPTGGSGTYTTHAWTGAGAAYLSATNIQNPVFSGAPAGTYALIYTVTDNSGCIGTDNITVTVNAVPTAAITPDPAVLCADGSLNMNGNPTGGSGTYTTHAWSAASCLPERYQHSEPSILGAPAGTYALIYTVTDNSGCIGTDNITVTVNAVPTAAITPDPAVLCADGSLNMNGNPTGGSGTYTTHAWTGAGAAYLSATNIQNPVFLALLLVRMHLFIP